MPEEYFVLNHYAFAHEGMGGDLAALANDNVLLDLDKSANLGILPDRTTVEIDQVRMANYYSVTQPNIGCNRHCVLYPPKRSM
jgi:hypothetical protein